MIKTEDVRKIALLARLEINEQEETQFCGQLNSILEYFEQLDQLDTDTVAPTTRAIEVSNVLRQDHCEPYQNRDSLLEEAPEQDGDFFRVPQILSTDED